MQIMGPREPFLLSPDLWTTPPGTNVLEKIKKDQEENLLY